MRYSGLIHIIDRHILKICQGFDYKRPDANRRALKCAQDHRDLLILLPAVSSGIWEDLGFYNLLTRTRVARKRVEPPHPSIW